MSQPAYKRIQETLNSAPPAARSSLPALRQYIARALPNYKIYVSDCEYPRYIVCRLWSRTGRAIINRDAPAGFDPRLFAVTT